MKILHVGKYITPVPGGMEKVVFELCSGLALGTDLKVSCLVSHIHSQTVFEQVNQFQIIRAARYGVIASTPLSPSFRKLGLNQKADLLHFHLPNPLATFSFLNCQTPYVVTYHCDIVRYKSLYQFYLPHLMRFLKASKKIIVSSQHLIDSSPILQQLRSYCQVIPFGIKTDHLQLSQSQKITADQLHEKYNHKMFLFVGRLVKYKGLHIAIPAMKDIDAHLVIVGQGPEMGALKKQTQDLGLESKVHFTGYLNDEELASYQSASFASILPSINESEAFGMCLLDALAFGKPIIATNVPTGVTMVNINETTGFNVQPGNAKAIADAANQLISNQPLYQKMSQNGLRHFQENFTHQKMIASHHELYKCIS